MLRTLCLLSILLASSAVAQTVTVETYPGPAEVPVGPETIAVLDVAALDKLAAFGVMPDGAVGPVYVEYLDDATASAVSVGTLLEPEYQALAALAPDLIIAGGRSYEAVPDLAKPAPTIDMTICEDVVGQGLARLAAYGEIFGREAEADVLARSFRSRLQSTRQAVAGQETALIVMTVGQKISAYGARGRFGWLLTALDLPEAVATAETATHGEAISFEFIREANPDILIVIDRLAANGQGGERARATLGNALVRETRAWKTGRVVHLDSAPLHMAGGGVQSMSLTPDQVATGLAGD